MRYLIIGGGLLIAGPWFCIAIIGWQTQPIIWLTALPAWAVTSSLIAIYLHWPAVQHERQIHLTEIERQKTDAYRLAQERKPKAERDPVSVDAEAERQYRWHRFWGRCVQYAIENGNSFSYRGCFENILDYPGWRVAFADPLVRARWLDPVQKSIRTVPGEGWTGVRMLAELSAGKPPPYPGGEPPEWKQTGAENTTKHGETVEFASEHRK